MSKRLQSSGVLDVVAGAIPGIRDILVLGKVKQIERSGTADLVLVDAPATGHTMTFLSSAGGLLDAARGGPIRAQAADVVELLTDPERCQVALVTLPEEMPVNEVIEAAYQLEDKVGLTLGPVIVNACYAPLDGLDTADGRGGSQCRGDPGCRRSCRPGRSAGVPGHPPGPPTRAARAPGRGAAPAPTACAVPVQRDHRSRRARRIGCIAGRRDQRTVGTRGPATVGVVMTEPVTLDELAAERSIIVCCGSGGVGKTTTAAAFALQAARLGRRACVVTIDPARRLANSLGLDALTNSPTEIAGPWPGELHALMLDPKGTFDDLVHRYADTPEQTEGILSNRIYRNLTGALSGTQEYMAMEKLYELSEAGSYDIIVVDTPPTRNALDFLDAPRRLTRFLENKVFRALMLPTRAGLRVMGVAAQGLLKAISKVAGADIVDDAVSFFQAFQGMEEGFQVSGPPRVRALLAEESTAFILVASPRPDSVDEAVHFSSKLTDAGMSATALIVNRVQPRFADDSQLAKLPTVPHDAEGSALDDLIENLRGFTAASDREEKTYEDLVADVAPAPVARVPLLNSDVHDLDGLATIADLLFVDHGESTAAGPANGKSSSSAG